MTACRAGQRSAVSGQRSAVSPIFAPELSRLDVQSGWAASKPPFAMEWWRSKAVLDGIAEEHHLALGLSIGKGPDARGQHMKARKHGHLSRALPLGSTIAAQQFNGNDRHAGVHPTASTEAPSRRSQCAPRVCTVCDTNDAVAADQAPLSLAAGAPASAGWPQCRASPRKTTRRPPSAPSAAARAPDTRPATSRAPG